MEKPDKIKAVVYPNTASPKLFKNKALEYLTKSHPAVINGMYLIISFFLIRYFYTHFNSSLVLIALLFFTAIFCWTFAEYVMHRWLYHKIGDATYNTGFQYLFHGIHHEYPNDKTRLVLPVVPSLILASIFFGLFYLIMGNYAFVFAPGFVIGYGLYMTIHYLVHTRKPPKKFNFWWRYHLIHHFQQHDRAFGVSSSLWDHVFGTLPEKNRRTVDVITKTGEENK